MKKQFICYMRVSTDKQEHGIDAQRITAGRYAESIGGQIAQEFHEKASGKIDDRAELANAITACKETGATLLIAKLDRLSRNAAFLHKLKDDLTAAKVEVIAADMPEAMGNTLMLAVMAGMAQQEREMTSKRTIEGLQAAKEKGVILGRPPGFKVSEETKQKIAAGNRKACKKPSEMVMNIAQEKRRDGRTYAQIAEYLNSIKAESPSGNPFTMAQVRRWLINQDIES